MANATNTPLNPKDLKEGLLIVVTKNPEWGTWRVDSDDTGWIMVGRSGARLLHERDCKFYHIAS